MKFKLFAIIATFSICSIAQDTACSPDGLGGFRCSTTPSLQQQLGGSTGIDLMSFQRGAELGEAHRQNEILRQQLLQQQMQRQQPTQQAPQQQPAQGNVQQHRIALPEQSDIAQPQAEEIQLSNQPGLLASVSFDGGQAMCVYKPAARPHFGVNGMALSAVRVSQMGTCGQRILLNANGSARTK